MLTFIALAFGVFAFAGCIICIIKLAFAFTNHRPKLCSSFGLCFCLILFTASLILPGLPSNPGGLTASIPDQGADATVQGPPMAASPATQGVLALLSDAIPERYKASQGKFSVTVSELDTFDVSASLEIDTEELQNIKQTVGNICEVMSKSSYHIRMLDFDIYTNEELWGTILWYDDQPGFTILQDGRMVESPIMDGLAYVPKNAPPETQRSREISEPEISAQEAASSAIPPDIEVHISDMQSEPPQSLSAEEAAAENQKLLQEMASAKKEMEDFLYKIIPQEQQVSKTPPSVTVSDRDIFGVYIPLDFKTDDSQKIENLVDEFYNRLSDSKYEIDSYTFEIYNDGEYWGFISRSNLDDRYVILESDRSKSSKDYVTSSGGFEDREVIIRSPAKEPPSSAEEKTETVWVTATGEKYHAVANCGNSDTNKVREIFIEEAKALGLGACKNCYITS